MEELPHSSCEERFIRTSETSPTSAQCSCSITSDSINCSITKDKCMVQVGHKTYSKSNLFEDHHEAAAARNATTVSSHISSESCRNRFDTSSFQQRAEALEGLLEFSARLLQQERFNELGVLVKPFGPEMVSLRETAIWLTKSFKETTA